MRLSMHTTSSWSQKATAQLCARHEGLSYVVAGLAALNPISFSCQTPEGKDTGGP